MKKTKETTQQKKHKNRGHLQDAKAPTSLAETVRYRLRPIPSKSMASQTALKDKKLFYAEVVPWRTMNMNDLLARMQRERPHLEPNYARMVLEVAMEAIVRSLKEGKRVTLDNLLTFGVSIPGRVDAGGTEIRGNLSLQPWVRFSPALIDRVNQDVQLTHIGVTQPVPEHLPSYNRLKEAAKKPPQA